MQNPNSNNDTNVGSNSNFVSKKIKIGNYLLGKTIGKGNSAVVKVAVHTLTKQKVAIKIFDKNALDNDKQIRLQREIDSMKRLRHPNIIRLYEIMETNKLICLVTEYASNGELYDYIIEKKRLSEREAKVIFRQIVTAINYCHSHGIVHRDLKVENLLFDAFWRVKLADFGFSCNFKQGELLDIFCGSPPYCAPELYLAKLYDGPKVDIWSLGVVLYVLVCGYLPFEAHSFNTLRSQVISGSYKIPFFLSEDCTSLINGMLNVDATKRFDINDILKHKWLKIDDEATATTSSVLNKDLDIASNPNEALKNFKDFKNLIHKIENISIEEIELNQDVINEISKYNLDINEIIKSLKNNEFDSNAGIYYLLEAKLLNKNYQEQTKSQQQNPNILNNNPSHKSNTIITLSQYTSPSLTPAAKNDCQIKFDFTYVNNTYLDEQASTTGSPLPTSTSNYHQSSSSSSSFLNNNNMTTTTLLGNNQQALIDNVSMDAGLASINRNQMYANNNMLPNYEQTGKLNFISVVDSSSMPSTPQLLIDPNCEPTPMNDEDEMPIEDLGRDYLSKYNSIRRHTIATNEDNNMMTASNNIMKSTECLLDLNQKSTQEATNANTTVTTHTDTINNYCGQFSLGANLNLAKSLNQPNHSGFEANSNGQFNLNLSQLINYNLSALGNTCGDLKNDYDYFAKNNNTDLTPTNLNANNNYSTGKYKKNYLIPSNYHKCKHKSKFQNLNYFYTNNNNNNNSSQENSNTNDAQNQSWSAQNNASNSLKQYQMHHIGPYLSPPIFCGRRASDGGTNISLFNQYYSTNSHRKNSNNGSNSQGSSSGNANGDDESLDENASTGCIKINDDEDENRDVNENSNHSEESELSRISLSSKPRGSITSGVPISSLKCQLSSNNSSSNFNQIAHQSSEDEDGSTNGPLNASQTQTAHCSNSNLIIHRKTNRNRIEPYMDNCSNGASIQTGLSSFRSRHREQSFSGSNSSPMYQNTNGPLHRGSEPNQFELIFANRSHLEKIYNQSLNKCNMPLKNENIVNSEDLDSSKWNSINLNIPNNCSQINEQSSCDYACPSLKSCISNKSLESISKLLTSEMNINTNKQSSNDYQDSNSINNMSNTMLSISPKNNSIQYGAYLSCDNNNINNNNANNSNVNNSSSNNNSSTASILIPVNNNQNSTNSPNGANNTLQMIQEEQNEISMLSSESSSLSSSVSTTPRLSRSSIGSGNTKTMLFNTDPSPSYPKSYMNRQEINSGESESTHANDISPYDVMDHVESNLIQNDPLKAESLIENLLSANNQNTNKNKNFCNGNLDDNDTCYFKKSKKTFTKHTC